MEKEASPCKMKLVKERRYSSSLLRHENPLTASRTTGPGFSPICNLELLIWTNLLLAYLYFLTFSFPSLRAVRSENVRITERENEIPFLTF